MESLRLLETLGYRSFDDPYATWVRFRRRGEVTAVRRNEPWTWTTVFRAPLELLAVVWSVPFVILMVGIPFVLAVALIYRVGRLLLNYF